MRTDPDETGVMLLSDRLASISPQRADVVTRLLVAGERLLREYDDGRIELQSDIAQQAPHAATAVLAHASGRITLALAGEHGSGALGDRNWHDFAGDARLIAWTLAYESLVAHLSDLL